MTRPLSSGSAFPAHTAPVLFQGINEDLKALKPIDPEKLKKACQLLDDPDATGAKAPKGFVPDKTSKFRTNPVWLSAEGRNVSWVFERQADGYLLTRLELGSGGGGNRKYKITPDGTVTALGSPAVHRVLIKQGTEQFFASLFEDLCESDVLAYFKSV